MSAYAGVDGTGPSPVFSAEWLVGIIAQLEGCAEFLGRLPVIANTTLMVRGDRLVVPYQPLAKGRGTGAVEMSLRYGAAVRAAQCSGRTRRSDLTI